MNQLLCSMYVFQNCTVYKFSIGPPLFNLEICLILICLGSVAQEGAYVSSVSPGCIGYGGGAITILGDGFATDGFSQFDPTKGNQVQGNLIQCYTQRMRL